MGLGGEGKIREGHWGLRGGFTRRNRSLCSANDKAAHARVMVCCWLECQDVPFGVDDKLQMVSALSVNAHRGSVCVCECTHASVCL